MKKRKKSPSSPTAESLNAAALFYLSRFASSEASLRRVLQNKIRRASMSLPEFANDKPLQETLTLAIETIIQKQKRLGAINDASFTEMKVSSLRRQGRSRRFIEQSLRQKTGVNQDLIKSALTAHDDETGSGDAEFQAATTYARRRRLGKYRGKELTDALRLKDLGAMARAGFQRSVSARALELSDDELGADA